MTINILQHDEILRSAQDDTVLGVCRGERRGDRKTIFALMNIFLRSPLLSPSLTPQMPVILSDSEGSLAFSRNIQKEYLNFIINLFMMVLSGILLFI